MAGHGPRTAGRLRQGLSAALIVLALILAPVALLGGVLRAELTSTDGFVDTFGPLADEPAIRTAVADRVTGRLSQQVVPQLVTRTLDALPGSGSDRAQTLVRGPLTAGITAMLDGQIRSAVDSPRFSSTWRGALTVAHAQFVATMAESPDALIVNGQNGELVLDLSPIVRTARTRLVQSGVGFASWIPDVQVDVQIAPQSRLGTLRAAYRAVDVVGGWAPPVAAVLLAAGLVLSPSRRRPLARAAAAGTIVWIALLLAVWLGGRLTVSALSSQGLPGPVAEAVYRAATGRIAVLGGVLGLVFLAAWVGTWLPARIRAGRARRTPVAVRARRTDPDGQRSGENTRSGPGSGKNSLEGRGR